LSLASDLVPGGEPERQDTPRKVANGR
jgi:hypothetical protein